MLTPPFIIISQPQGPLVHHTIFKADRNATLDAMKARVLVM